MHIAHRLFVALFVVLAIPLETAEAKKTAPEKSYDTVVLWAVGMERKDQRKIEESVAKLLAKKGVMGLPITDLTEEGAQYTQQQVLELIVASGATAIFEVTDAGVDGTKQIRPFVTQDVIHGRKGKESVVGLPVGSGRFGGAMVPQGMGGSSLRHDPHRFFMAYLIDIESGERLYEEKVRVTAKERDKFRIFAGKAFRKAARETLDQGLLAANN
jgi:hypothetical protein